MKINSSNYPENSSLDRLRVFVSRTLGARPGNPSKQGPKPPSAAKDNAEKTKADKVH
ncbi:hypothetical protein [Hyphococcus sp. DH-69]|uniref:hypothetical protein n=1 Tax=Hyphococcus formosus TaxID=3143534 RepID=UPI00398AF5D1